MKAKKFLVETMFRNILTAGTFAVVMLFGITSCSDELSNDTSDSQSDAGSVYTYLMNHVHERNCWAPKSVRVRAAYETILLWKKGYGKNVAGKENFENMAEDFNALIPSIYQLSKMGFDI